MDNMPAVQIAGTDEGTLSLDGCHCTIEASAFISSIGDIIAEAAAEIWDQQCVSAFFVKTSRVQHTTTRIGMNVQQSLHAQEECSAGTGIVRSTLLHDYRSHCSLACMLLQVTAIHTTQVTETP